MAEKRPTLHHLENSQSMRILWLLEELEVDYDLKLYDRIKSGPKEQRAPAELEKIHQLGKSPLLVTADGRAIVESSAIANYLIKTYDTQKKFQGDATTGNDEVRNNVLTSFGGTSLSVIMSIEMMFELIATKSPFLLRPLMSGLRSQIQKTWTRGEFEKSWKFLQDELGDQDYFMGSRPGLADFMLSWPFDFCTARKYVDLTKYPRLEQWQARCQARDGWKRARGKGNTYSLGEFFS